MTRQLSVVLLAAGAGNRMGGVPKCLIERDGVPLLRSLLQSVSDLRPAHTVLVLGHHADAIGHALQTWPPNVRPTVVRNPLPGESPASSLRLGLRTLLESSAAPHCAMVLLADMPLLTTDDLHGALCAFAARTAHQRILWPVHGKDLGHPVLLEVGLAREWLAQHELGLRAWAQQNAAQVATWHPGHARCTTDMDTPEDLARLAQIHGGTWTLPARA